MDQTQLLGTLLSLVEEQTQTNGQLQADLRAQIIALSEVTKAANQTVEAVKQAAKDVNPAVRIGAEKAVTSGIGESLNGIAGEIQTALDEALKPIIGDLVGAARSANQVEEKLNRVKNSFGWKWALVVGGTALALVAVISLFAWGAVWYQRYQVEKLIDEKAALQTQVAELQDNVNLLAKKGGRIKLGSCGPKNRLCVQIESNQGDGAAQQDFKGAWYSDDGKTQFVIPKGY
jgi:hypothetical protein